MKYAILALFICFSASTVFSDQKYNSHTQTWESTSPDSVLKYNSHERQWQFADPEAKPRYNAHQRTWQLATDTDELGLPL